MADSPITPNVRFGGGVELEESPLALIHFSNTQNTAQALH
jgi:hypothetical protein